MGYKVIRGRPVAPKNIQSERLSDGSRLVTWERPVAEDDENDDENFEFETLPSGPDADL